MVPRHHGFFLDCYAWLNDPVFRGLTHEQKGVLWDVLLQGWVRPVPADPTLLQRFLRLTPADFARIWPPVARYFTIDNGYLVSPLIARERSVQGNFLDNQAVKGRLGARARWRSVR